MTNTIITIGREFGSGGCEIGHKLAEKLGIKCYDKDMLDLAAKESGICQEIFESHDEKPTNSFLYSLVMDTYSFGYSSGSYTDMPLNHKVFLAQFDAIKKIAKAGPCVLVGRCADYALEDNPELLSVFIHADMDARIRRIARDFDLTDAKAKDMIRKTDKQLPLLHIPEPTRQAEISYAVFCLNKKTSPSTLHPTLSLKPSQARKTHRANIHQKYNESSNQ